ncbi:hypothetical protein Misp06_00361 [Microbulbifer sp. NBRC 101763]|uniref:GNAT family N-acetyltransferase n=1 Tax=Microbulbifer sp. NBRC 101763 TaxID=1113820 RepID=UPI0030A393CE
MQIRYAMPCDGAQLLKMMRVLAKFEGYLSEFKVNERELKSRLFEQADFKCLVAEDNGVIVGYLAFYPLPFTYDLTPWFWIKELYVNDSMKYRRKGIGKSLMQQLIYEARKQGSTKIKWEVLCSNINAQDFYKQLGASVEQQWQTWSLSTKEAKIN